ncbi:MAG: sulfotransferase, partial [Methyloceanibacter sp.]
MPDYEVVPEEEAGKVARRKRPKPRMPALTIERYGGRLVYIWFGMRARDLLKLFKRGRYNFTLNCIPDVLALWLWVPWNGVLRRLSEAKYAKAAEAVKLDTPPVFILGHWRTGTTLLHDLFAEDPNLAFPTTYECFFPHHFLISEGRL